jgi:hypothetical protein
MPGIWLDGDSVTVHRLYAPAIIGEDGTQEWLVNGRLITDQVLEWIER